jgi:putative flippase GtrA
VGGLFAALTVPGLYVSREILGLPLVLASLLTWEVGTVLRFGITDRWVFRQRRPTWERFFQYHAAAGSSFLIWWVGTNLMPRWGIHYLLASILATGCSVTWSLLTNYLWVWRCHRGEA